jgi:hypothetical protein
MTAPAASITCTTRPVGPKSGTGSRERMNRWVTTASERSWASTSLIWRSAV